MATDRKIDVYVRLDDSEKGREISFRIPDDTTQEEILAEGYAIDGNQALVGISAYTDEDTGLVVTLGEALRNEELSLLGWLRDKKGYTVKFV